MGLDAVAVPEMLLSNWARVGISRTTFATGAEVLFLICTSSNETLAAPSEGEEMYLKAIYVEPDLKGARLMSSTAVHLSLFGKGRMASIGVQAAAPAAGLED